MAPLTCPALCLTPQLLTQPHSPAPYSYPNFPNSTASRPLNFLYMLFHSLECSSPTPNCHTNSNSFFERQLKLCFFGVALPDCLQRSGPCLTPGNTSIATILQLASRTPHKLKARASTSSLHFPNSFATRFKSCRHRIGLSWDISNFSSAIIF